MFVRAYRGLAGADAVDIECLRPRQHLGRLSLVRRPVVLSDDPGWTAAEHAGVPATPHHVCLMRAPELVVKYAAGPEPFAADLAYAGVFRVDDPLDETFAKAEPPTHDEWVDDHLVGRERTFVRTAWARIGERLREFARPAAPSPGGSDVALGGISAFLGSLIAVAGGEGGSARAPERVAAEGRGGGSVAGASGGSARGRAARLVGIPEWIEYDGELLLVQEFALPDDMPGAQVRAELAVRTADGGREADPPRGAVVPSVVGWRLADGSFDFGSETEGAATAVYIRPADDTVVDIDVRVTERVRA
jgi:hypothetical protein